MHRSLDPYVLAMATIVEQILKFAKNSYCTVGSEIDNVHRVGIVCSVGLRDLFDRFVTSRANIPLLFQYSSDSTPATTKQRFESGVADYNVNRRGKCSKHINAERAYICDLSGRCRVLFGLPREVKDTSAAAHFACFRKLCRYPRELLHVGVCHTHHVWDRALKTACERLHHQFTLAVEDRQAFEQTEGETYRLWCLTFFTAVGCFMHDAHNGFKKGVCFYLTDAAAMRSMWICLESARSSFGLLMLYVGSWVTSRLTYEAWDFPCAREMWSLLGFKDRWVDLLVDLEIRFTDSRLRVSPRFIGNERLPELITAVMLKAWTFKRWSDSRWLTVGGSCRTMLASQLLGLSDLVRFIIGSGASRYHIGGFADHLSDTVMQMVGTICTSSTCMDAVLLIVMADDRVPRQLPKIDQTIRDKLDHTAGIHEDIWRVISAATGDNANLLRNRSIGASLTSATYLEVRLREARRLPWSLLQGDISHNLDLLKNGPCPEEINASKMWHGMRLGISKSVYEDECKLMEKASWSSNGTEQQHVTTTGMMRFHKDLGMGTLQSRSMCVAMRPLVSECAVHRKLRAARRQMEALNRKRPECRTGRQQYLCELHGQVRIWKESGRYIEPGIQEKIMRSHGARWNSMDWQGRAEYDERALDTSAAAQDALDEKKKKMIASIRDLQTIADRSKCFDSPLVVSSCRLSEADIMELDAAFCAKSLSKAIVEEIRSGYDVVTAPPETEMAALSSIELPSKPALSPRPAWVGLLAWNREFFSGCIFRVTDAAGPGQHAYLKFTLGVQSPYLAGFMEMNLQPEFVSVGAASAWEDEGDLESWPFVFKLNYSYVFSDAWPFAHDAQLDVLIDSLHLGDRIVVSSMASWKTLAEIEPLLPPISETQPGGDKDGSGERGPAVWDDRWKDCPWIHDFLDTGHPRSGKPSVHANGPAHDLHMVDAEEVFESLEAARLAWSDREHIRCVHFRWRLLGGKWTGEHKGIAYDSFEASSRGADVKSFCLDWGLPREAVFTISVYGEEGSFSLACAWCHRLQWIYDKALEDDGVLHAFGDLDMAPYMEPDDLAALVALGDARTCRRIDTIRAIRPHDIH